jgi:hypothetical protein
VKIHNELPRLLDCLSRWEKLPPEREFQERYLDPMEPLLRPMLEDFSSFRGIRFYEYVRGLDWAPYRAETLDLDPQAEERRLRRELAAVEDLLGVELEGEVVLFGAFTLMDGYARFDRGTHRVYLGVDEEHGEGPYLDVLISHELTHVARESRAPVWTGWGLDPRMTHDQLVEGMSVAEHLASEGFSCVVSELLHPDPAAPWSFVYQSQSSYAEVLRRADAVSARIHRELRDPEGFYRRLYDVEDYGTGEPVPYFSHYVWAWQWMRHLLEERAGGDPRKLLAACSKDWVEDALAFRLK